MVKKITIEVPDEIGHYAKDVGYFMESMLRKLYLNRHKGFAEGVTVSKATELLDGEVIELKDALLFKGQFDAFFEAVDVANMALLTGLVTTRLTRNEYDKGRDKK